MAARPTPLLYTVWEITLRCDLSCGHCGSRAGKARSDELSTAEALDVVEQIADMGCREMTLIGGEAYLRPDWTQIARAAVDRGLTVSMTTGGRGLTPERAAQAKAAGMSSVSVSIDGLEASHDKLRNLQGSWQAATQAVKNAREAGLLVSVNTQVNRVNRGELDGLLELLDAWGCFAWQVQFTVPMGRAADNWEWLLQPVDFLEAVPMVAALKLAAKERGIDVYPGNNVGYFGPHEHTLRGDHYRRGHTLGCTAGHSTLGLEADGKVKGCPSLPSGPYTGGNVRERPIREIWEETAELRFTRDRTIELWGFCGSCYYAEECRAGCTWTSHVIMGRPGNNPYCHHRALERQREGLAERMVPAEPAPGEPFDHGRFELVLEPLARKRLPVVEGAPA